MKKLTIIGLGLLGTSLAMALKQHGGYRITGWTRRADVRRRLAAAGQIDVAADSFEEAIAAADLTVLALPIPQIIDYLAAGASVWRPGTVVTDLGSVKGVIMAAAARDLTPRNVIFIGSHPMAGTEKSGADAAFPTLFANADVFVTPPESALPGLPAALTGIDELWRDVGAHPHRIAAAAHDNLVAHTSHVLHVVASALATAILDAPDPETRLNRFRGCATGFRDTSRIASSNPVMWREIIEHNQAAVLSALRSFETRCSRLSRLIEQGDFAAFQTEFARGKELRDEWLQYKGF